MKPTPENATPPYLKCSTSLAALSRLAGLGANRDFCRRMSIIFLAMIASSFAVSKGEAADKTWDGGGNSNNWNTPQNWAGDTVPLPNDVLIFSGMTRLSSTNNLDANTAFSGITFASDAGAFNMTGNVINLGGNIINNSTAVQTIRIPLILTSNIEINTANGPIVLGNTTGTTMTGAFDVTKTGAGLLTLQNGNPISGTFSINSGTVRAASGLNTALGQGALLLNGGHLELAAGGGLSYARNTTISANTSITSDRFAAGAGVNYAFGTLSIGSQNLTVKVGSNVTSGTASVSFGSTTLTGDPVFSIDSGALLTLGAISGSTTLTKSGPGTLVVGTTSSFSGTTAVNDGVMRVGNVNALQLSTIAVNKDNSIQFAVGPASTVNFGGLTGTSALVITSTNNSAITLQIGASNASTTYSGILSGNGGLNKIGTGSLTLTEAHTYLGTTAVNNGTLILNGSLVSSSVNVSASGVLSGTGTVGGTLTVTGTLAPGVGTGTLRVGNDAVLSVNATTLMEIGGTAPGSFDRLVLTSMESDLTLGGTIIVSLVNDFTPEIGDSFDLFEWSGSLIHDNFNIDEDLLLPSLSGGLAWNTSHFFLDGSISVVPEPETWALLAAGAGLLLLRRRLAI